MFSKYTVEDLVQEPVQGRKEKFVGVDGPIIFLLHKKNGWMKLGTEYLITEPGPLSSFPASLTSQLQLLPELCPINRGRSRGWHMGT